MMELRFVNDLYWPIFVYGIRVQDTRQAYLG
jgi:hypothetical protein